jgi:hypothetical protein
VGAAASILNATFNAQRNEHENDIDWADVVQFCRVILAFALAPMAYEGHSTSARVLQARRGSLLEYMLLSDFVRR